MTPYQVGWLDEAGGGKGARGRWAKLLAPIITALLVIAVGATVFGLMSSDDPSESPARPAAAEPAR